jgi:hypothetical protein
MEKTRSTDLASPDLRAYFPVFVRTAGGAGLFRRSSNFTQHIVSLSEEKTKKDATIYFDFLHFAVELCRCRRERTGSRSQILVQIVS